MRINSRSEPLDVTGVQSKGASQQTAAVSEESQDSLTTTDVDDLKKSLNTASDVRADKVAKAKVAIEGGNYPTDSMLSQVAGLLAKGLSAQS
jgi:anti-sigma28 factor (negative regulator of flagellin synthesis)